MSPRVSKSLPFAALVVALPAAVSAQNFPARIMLATTSIEAQPDDTATRTTHSEFPPHCFVAMAVRWTNNYASSELGLSARCIRDPQRQLYWR